ncbi:MAG: hypothetical protein QG637_110 [Chloroflexota bacterium]|nr:hypothetical protein [Chloroflexota bacterium]
MSKPRKAQLPKVTCSGSVGDRPELGGGPAGSVGDSTPRRFGRRPELRRGLAGAGGAGNDPEAGSASTAERVRRLVGDGAGLLAAKRPGEALPKLQEALSLDPDNVSAAINLGGAFILQGQHAQAVPALETASRLEPDNAMVWSNLAAAHLGKLPFSTQAHQDRAIAAYERALALDPRAPNVHYNLGLIYLERNEMARAAAHFSSALETNPNDRDAQLWLNRTQSGRGPADQTGPDNPRDG